MKNGIRVLAVALALCTVFGMVSCDKAFGIVYDVIKDVAGDILYKDEVVVEYAGVQVDDKMFSVFFNDTVNSWYDSYATYANYFSVNFKGDLKAQQFGATSYDEMFLGKFSGSWYDYFMDQTLENVKTYVILADYAHQRGIELDETDLESVDACIDGLSAKMDMVGASYEDWYGRGVKKEDAYRCYELMQLASKAMESLTDNLESSVSESEMLKWCDKNTDQVYTQDDKLDDSLTHNYAYAIAEDQDTARRILDRLRSKDVEDIDEFIDFLERENFGENVGYGFCENVLSGSTGIKDIDAWIESEDRKAGDLSDVINFKESSTGIKFYTGGTVATPNDESDPDEEKADETDKVNDFSANTNGTFVGGSASTVLGDSASKIEINGVYNGAYEYFYTVGDSFTLGDKLTISGGTSSLIVDKIVDKYAVLFFDGHGDETWRVIAKEAVVNEKIEKWMSNCEKVTVYTDYVYDIEFVNVYVTSNGLGGVIITYDPSTDGNFTTVVTPSGNED